MKIPKVLQLFGRDIKIVFNNKLLDEKDLYGESRFTENEIMLGDCLDGIKIDQDSLNATFCHEIMHWIFHLLGYADLRKDEIKVAQISELLYQVIKQIDNDK